MLSISSQEPQRDAESPSRVVPLPPQRRCSCPTPGQMLKATVFFPSSSKARSGLKMWPYCQVILCGGWGKGFGVRYIWEA